MTASEPAQAMLAFLRDSVIEEPSIVISERTSLVSSGLIDSFSLIEILLHLESVTGRKIPAAEVSVGDFETVEDMLRMADRAGTPR